MRVLGVDRIAAYARKCENSVEAETLWAWLSELRHRSWDRPLALARDFRNADISALPKVIFHLASVPIRIETLVDFRTTVVLVTDIKKTMGVRDFLGPQFGIG